MAAGRMRRTVRTPSHSQLGMPHARQPNLAASEQATPGEEAKISYEDDKGRWHTEVDSAGNDRPRTTVEG